MTKYSGFGEHFRRPSGTRQLMDDLGAILTSGRPVSNLGGGNPGIVPELVALFRTRMQALIDCGGVDSLIGNYDGPQGHQPFLVALAEMLNKQFRWGITAANIATTTGSQASFFTLFNILAGPTCEGLDRHVLLPLTPEYIGYADVGLNPNMLRAIKPRIDITDTHSFKYHIDFDALTLSDVVAAVCVSRPTNPTGNVITNEELQHLVEITRTHNVPLIVDNAYGLPFPNIVFNDAQPIYEPHMILCMSLSKLGLPGLRTGIVIAAPDIIQTITSVNAITMLANSALGASLVHDLIETDTMEQICATYIKPFYARKATQARAWFREYFADLNYYLHETEGAIFLWAWFPDLKVTDLELYERLKERDVLVLAGCHFFPGLAEPWQHTRQCLRISYAGEEKTVRHGLRVISEEVRRFC